MHTFDTYNYAQGLVTDAPVTLTIDTDTMTTYLATANGWRGQLTTTRDSAYWCLIELVTATFRVLIHRDDWRTVEALALPVAAQIAQAATALPDVFNRVSAAEQRRLFGGAPFGKRQVRHEPGRGFVVRRIVDYGRDWNDQRWSYAEVAQLVTTGRSVVGKKD